MTTESIAIYAGRTCTNTQDIGVALGKLDDTLIAVPIKGPIVGVMTK